MKGEKGYIVGGNTALKLHMKYERLVVSTRKPIALKEAIDSIKKS
ncbi:hypothetical protein [Evansella halocellulosilytica]|nr:hypothetical protein [Evansella halocellulosilytica]